MKALTISGLILDSIGVFILFYSGLPFKMPNRALFIEDPITESQKKKDHKRRIIAYFGLGCLQLGFILQMIGASQD